MNFVERAAREGLRCVVDVDGVTRPVHPGYSGRICVSCREQPSRRAHARRIIEQNDADPQNQGANMATTERLTTWQAVRQSQLCHPDWTVEIHKAWLVENGYDLAHFAPYGEGSEDRVIAGWLLDQSRRDVTTYLSMADTLLSSGAHSWARLDTDSVAQALDDLRRATRSYLTASGEATSDG